MVWVIWVWPLVTVVSGLVKASAASPTASTATPAVIAAAVRNAGGSTGPGPRDGGVVLVLVRDAMTGLLRRRLAAVVVPPAATTAKPTSASTAGLVRSENHRPPCGMCTIARPTTCAGVGYVGSIDWLLSPFITNPVALRPMMRCRTTRCLPGIR